MAERIGPFDAFLSEYDKMRASQNVEDRTNEQWPTAILPNAAPHLQYSPSPNTTRMQLDDLIRFIDPSLSIPPMTKLGRDLGARDIEAPSKEEVLRYLMHNAATGPDPSGGK